MSDARLNLHNATHPDGPVLFKRPLGRHLVEAGKITNTQLIHALERQKTIAAPLGEILVSDGAITPADVMSAVAHQNAAYEVDLKAQKPDPALARLASRRVWLKHRAVPVSRVGRSVLMAMPRPDQISALKRALPGDFPDIIPVIAPEHEVQDALASLYRKELTAYAETRLSSRFSCRHWGKIGPWRTGFAGFLIVSLILGVVLTPGVTFAAICVFTVMCLFTITLLKLTAAVAHIGHSLHAEPPPPDIPQGRWPRISVMVPLFKETEIASALITRLQKITYPKVLLDVVLVLEEKDTLTRDTIARCDLPHWMRVVEVPDGGGITTKPRALNYALDFCKGDIVGIWDAEDAPAPDQLHHVAARFAHAPRDVVCLQGILDYYNPRANWLSRCFTLEYAGWFRVILPGLARLGLVIPLGGTTLFLRRDKIHKMGGWDAHNVTEDADLGVRIARLGYRTETIATPTYEEANCRLWPWIKQRSRWLKGFMVTYGVHMRRPRALLRDLGWKRFLGFQAFFIGTLSQFLFAPILWTFWLKMLAFPHPTQSVFSQNILVGVATLFLVTEVVNLGIAFSAAARKEHRFLIPWALTLPVYFPLGTIAAYKALYELIVTPFYWDKTQHGHSKPDAGSGV